VESCRPTVGDTESTSDSLSPPPEFLAENGISDDDDDDDELARLEPYDYETLISYPESKVELNEEEAADAADVQDKVKRPKITDCSKFVESLEFKEDEDIPYKTLYRRCLNAQHALVTWQDEFTRLNEYIKVMDPTGSATGHKNPRIPDHKYIGRGYQDQLESFVYGYQLNTHESRRGQQDPIGQRQDSSGRELRQRVKTQKAAEGDLTTDNEDTAGGRRRGRRRKILDEDLEDDIAGGSGSRARDTSGFDSPSRDQTPQKVFASGKPVGRPRKGKVTSGSRLKQVHQENDSQNESTPEPAYANNQTHNGVSQTIETTVQYEDSEAEEPVARPGTSDSTLSGTSTDDLRDQAVRPSTKSRKRQNTSDFEDALPSSKRIGKRAKITHPNGFGENGETEADNVNNAEKGLSRRKSRQDESRQLISLVPTDELVPQVGSKPGKGKEVAGRKKGESVKKRLEETDGAGSSEIAAAATAPAPKLGVKASKDGSTPSRASLNMMRRWAAKKKAEAEGLPVPKIGRYPKGESLSSTPDVVGSPDLSTPNKNPGVRKRKREEEEPSPANMGETGLEDNDGFKIPPKKGRGRQSNKVTDPEPESLGNSSDRDVNQEADLVKNLLKSAEKLPVDEPAQAPTPKKKGRRPKQRAVEAEHEAEGLAAPDIEAAPEDEEVTRVDAQQNGVNRKLSSQGKPRGGRPKKEAVVAQASSDDAMLANGEMQLDTQTAEEFVQPPPPRTSGRNRRQTSIAAESQTATRRGSKSSIKMTATPTPTPTIEDAEQAEIKPEAPEAPTFAKKRGRQPKSAAIEASIDPQASSKEVDAVNEPPAKRRKVGAKKATSDTPASLAGLVEAQTTQDVADAPENIQEAPTKKRGGFKRKKVLAEVPATSNSQEYLGSDARISAEEPVVSRKGRGRPKKTGTQQDIDAPATKTEDEEEVAQDEEEVLQSTEDAEVAPETETVEEQRKRIKKEKMSKIMKGE
jgi:hypothetical protein